MLKTRILDRLKVLGLSEPEVTRRAGLHKHTIQNIKKGHIPSANRLAALAGALGVPSTYLTGETDAPDVPSLSQINTNDSNHPSLLLKVDYILGEVRAGTWLETADWPMAEQIPLALLVDTEYGRLPRFGVIARGPSMNEVYPEGTVLICVRLEDLRRDLESGERVFVHRTRPDGLIEATAKEYVKRSDGTAELWPRSTDPEHRKPLILATGEDDGDNLSVRIHALIIGSYRPERTVRNGWRLTTPRDL